MWKRLWRLLLRWQAPQSNPATPEDHLTPARLGHLDGYAKPYAGPYAKPYAGPYARDPRTPPRLRRQRSRRQEPPRGASRPQKARATGPPWGRGASAFDPSVTRPAARSRLRRRLIHSAVRLPHGALVISRTPTARRHLRWRSHSNRAMVKHKRNVTHAVTNETSHSACSAVTIRPSPVMLASL